MPQESSSGVCVVLAKQCQVLVAVGKGQTRIEILHDTFGRAVISARITPFENGQNPVTCLTMRRCSLTNSILNL